MRRLALFAEAWVHLAFARLLCGLLPFRRVMALAARHPRCPRAPDEAAIARIVRAIDAAARRAPFRAVCYEQGLAAQAMLRRRGFAVQLHYGAAHDESGQLAAHVWTRCGGLPVTGCAIADRFALIASFPPTAEPLREIRRS